MFKTGFVTSLAVTFLLILTFVSAADNQQSEKSSPAESDQQPSQAAIKRTRETVQMLDDIYKQTIVLITDKYVNSEADFPAGSAAVELFKRVGKTGFHQVRIIDATGEPYEPENVAKSPFEKEGIQKLKSGKSYYDKVVIKEGQAYLQAMTPVPVVMKKCVMCHPHYKDVKAGQPIGAISYELPVK
jgi:hypothetical protein